MFYPVGLFVLHLLVLLVLKYRKVLIEEDTYDLLSFIKHVGVRLKLLAKHNVPAFYSVALILLLFRI